VFLRRARVNLSGRFIEEFNFRAELELAGSLTDTSAFRAQMTERCVRTACLLRVTRQTATCRPP
jgi:hypothetical protein